MKSKPALLASERASRRPADGHVPAGAAPANRGKWFLLGSIVVTLALFYLPYGRKIGFPLVFISTVAHEFGHALAALLVGGRVESVEIYFSTGGVAHTMTSGRIASGLVSAGGLVGPAIAAAMCFVFARSARLARITLVLLGALLTLSVLFWVRNAFGLVYVPLLAAALLAIGWKARPDIAQMVLVFLAVQLSLSVYSRGDYLFTPVADMGGGEQHPSDVANMASALLLPYWFWGGICAAFSAVVLIVGLWLFLRARLLPSLSRPRAAAKPVAVG